MDWREVAKGILTFTLCMCMMVCGIIIGFVLDDTSICK